ncbi:MAG: ABC transporter ATP-binding protein [Caldiserica bacterium]|nr:MAG: ABC transporter ATP-binding protein [Caldisericota bacterium]
MEKVVEVNNLKKYYGDIKAVDGISFDVYRGEIFGMLGPNGAGKTTTIEIMEGLRIQDSGEAKIFGLHNIHDREKIKMHIGVQLQETSFIENLTVCETVKLFRNLYNKVGDEAHLISTFFLEDKKNSLIKTLSGGQKQRLSILLSLINDPDTIFLDEPTTGLDPQARRNIWEIIIDLKRNGKTIFLTTHYMEEAEKLCDRVLIIDHGKVIALDSPERLIKENFEETPVDIKFTQSIESLMFDNLNFVSRTLKEEDVITVYMKNFEENLPSLLNFINLRGLKMKEMKIRKPTLEDVFLKLTGRRIRE